MRPNPRHGPLRELSVLAGGQGLSLNIILVGESIHRQPVSLTSLECQVSELVNSDACPIVTRAHAPRQVSSVSDGTRRYWLSRSGEVQSKDLVQGMAAEWERKAEEAGLDEGLSPFSRPNSRVYGESL